MKYLFLIIALGIAGWITAVFVEARRCNKLVEMNMTVLQTRAMGLGDQLNECILDGNIVILSEDDKKSASAK
ncbi:TPA: hypothetical protein ROG05_000129 [Enterobacter soli]|uniref:hypothetical protein n=1 Tax=Enterobacter kobei TaxID=208224 RepID=UPI00287C55A1|nr:hypothetical protein [Enterobacter soli]HDX4047789.1 hypothetical protein [Enterobacter soli]